jgi:hypothetical protein
MGGTCNKKKKTIKRKTPIQIKSKNTQNAQFIKVYTISKQ